METILLVDHDEKYVEELGEGLQGLGHRVFWAKNSDQVFDCLGVQKVELIFLEPKLEGEDGFEILKKLKTNERYKWIPVVILSVLSDSVVMDEAERIGVRDYLIKGNMKVDDLVERIQREYVVD